MLEAYRQMCCLNLTFLLRGNCSPSLEELLTMLQLNLVLCKAMLSVSPYLTKNVLN